jgi:acetylornithine deacetylase/succinyl-diaminopimelate desuccinylase-like protein
MDRNGRILVRDWLPAGGMPPKVKALLDGCPIGGGGEAASVDPGWGEPGLTPAEKIYGWQSFIVLAMVSGRPENPVNAVAPDARAHCQIRYTVDAPVDRFEPALRAHLDAHGFDVVTIENAAIRMPASRTDADDPWVRFARASLSRTLGRPVQVIPNSSGGLPGDVFVDHLGVPLVWIPHSYSGCKQHGPDEHLLKATAREGIAGFAGIWWDLGEAGAPAARS